MNYLLIDIGSTAIKWLLYEPGNAELRPASLPFPPRIQHPDPRIFTVDPGKINACISFILKAALENRKEIRGIFISTQMHGHLLGDAQGNVITPYISWQDERSLMPAGEGNTYFERFKRQYPEAIFPGTGTSLKPNLPACSLYAQTYRQSEVMEAARVFYTLGSYIAYTLTGQNHCHATDAAATGFYDVEHGRENELLLRNSPYCRLEYPAMHSLVRPVGEYRGIPVYSPVGDQQAAALGCGLEPGDVLLNLGTAAQACGISECFAAGHYESRPYFHNRYLNTVTGLTGGRDIGVLTRFIQGLGERIFDCRLPEPEIWKRGLALAHRQPGMQADLHFHSGRGGEFSSIFYSDFTPDAFFAAVVEALASEYAAAVARLPAGSRLRFTGGLAQHLPELAQRIAAALNLPFSISEPQAVLDGLIHLVHESEG
jgi:sugar (pentulose or hexulose) kinase